MDTKAIAAKLRSLADELDPSKPGEDFTVDADGLRRNAVVEALCAEFGPTVAIPGVMPGEPNVAPVVVPRLLQSRESVDSMPEGDDRVRAVLSLNASELHQNRAVRYVRAPAWKPWLTWVEGDTIPGAVSGLKGEAWLAQAIVGRYRLIRAGEAQPHFLMLIDRDFVAGQ